MKQCKSKSVFPKLMQIKMTNKFHFVFLLVTIIFISCSEEIITDPESVGAKFISAADISSYPEIAEYNPIFYNTNGSRDDFLNILKTSGVNTIRLRLWVNPANRHSGFDEVKQFSSQLKNMGFKIWLTLHYSDTWADPGHQEKPQHWKNLSINALKDSVFSYTEKIVLNIKPDFIQIGNEINSGILHPSGDIINNPDGFSDLIKSGISAVRKNSSAAKIIIHYAGTDGAESFFNLCRNFDYDIIGLSYYPIWHGKSLENLENSIKLLSQNFNKQILIAETAYPFTLGWNDYTNNIVGMENQLLPGYPATPDGQRNFINKIKNIILNIKTGLGFCYWGGELISWKGQQAKDASSWENQALFDFNNKFLPVLNEFK